MCFERRVVLTIGCALVTLLFAALICSIAGCSGEAKPPSIGVFLKNPGEDFIVLTDVSFGERDEKALDKIREDVMALPLAKDGAKVVFYDVDIDYSRLLLMDELSQDRRATVEKVSGDTYVVTLSPDSLWTAIFYLGYSTGKDSYRVWLFRGEGPRTITQMEDGQIIKQVTIYRDKPEGPAPEHGRYTTWYKGGQKKEEGEYLYGNKNGTWTFWHDNGQKREEGEYIQTDTTVSGALEIIDPNIRPFLSKLYETMSVTRISEKLIKRWVETNSRVNQEVTGKALTHLDLYLSHRRVTNSLRGFCKQGKWTKWYENGQKEEEGDYSHGEQTGAWTTWHENGQKKSEGEYVCDYIRHRQWTTWHENGQLESQGVYTDGKKTGMWTFWHENGQKASEGEYVIFRERTSDEILSRVHDSKLRAFLKECWDIVRLHLTDPIGIAPAFDEFFQKQENWRLEKTRKALGLTFKDLSEYFQDFGIRIYWGNAHGKWTYWHENGQTKANGEFVDGQKHGLWKFWDEDGNLIEEVSYIDGVKIDSKEN